MTSARKSTWEVKQLPSNPPNTTTLERGQMLQQPDTDGFKGVSASPASTEGKGGIHGHSETVGQYTDQNASATAAAEMIGYYTDL